MSGTNVPGSLRVYVYGANSDPIQPIVRACLALLERDHRIVDSPAAADVAIAPLLTEFLTPDAINAPRVGTLVFHPSLLPRHRGGDAIRWAFELGETYSGITWFWPDSGIDTGDICEQEVLAILPGDIPRDYYARAVIPAAVRTLARAIEGVAAGHPRRVPQQREHGTYEPRMKRRGQ